MSDFEVHPVGTGRKIAALEAALTLWLAYDDQDEADFAQAGPMLLYARAIDATRNALGNEQVVSDPERKVA